MTTTNHLYATPQEIEWLKENHLLISTLEIEKIGNYGVKVIGDNAAVQLTRLALNESGPNKIDKTAQF